MAKKTSRTKETVSVFIIEEDASLNAVNLVTNALDSMIGFKGI